ncbi:nucleotide exchange factor GrpE [Ammoniphilus sp. CFH 90114]|uniref:nucleotide exchange factor GrpE n=1 Tax=Ammoniphilus sp. CFH 90114 TaxID=2493665 RepID=UPI00100F7393|nr:nucleotide exchange factor GrpE [Ammoniphilus sp. CFH 90114]RXT14812.1 nucleotide exchange factor GrpE [Ammoniphilus sp. CFH 90114]
MEEKNQAEQEFLESEVKGEVQEETVDSAELEQNDPLAALKQEAEENYNRYLRVQADFDNFRKRTRKEKEELQKYASLPLIEGLLPALDNLERALAAGQNTGEHSDSLIKGVEMVFRQIQSVLEQEGLKQIEAQGNPFDPQFHQAVMQEESAEYEAGIVIQELQKGYVLKDRVIRPSMVKVSS